LDACEEMMERGLVRPGCHLTPYPCDQCSEFHITNRVIVPLRRNWSDLRGRQPK